MNSLWPRTTIATAAVEVFFPAVAREAAASPRSWPTPRTAILTRDSRSTTGNFFIDDEVLRGRRRDRFLAVMR